MTSFVIVARDREKRITYANEYCRKLEIDAFDITLIERDAEAKSSIGIEEVKNMQKKIFLRPLKSKTKAILIEESHLLTTEAQNSLLKVLEEPPSNTIIMLLSESKENLLPTIISRCKVITLEEEKKELSEKEREEYAAFIERLPTMTIGERLKKAELLAKDKEKGIEWIEKLILVLREKLLQTTLHNLNSSLTSHLSTLTSHFSKLHTLLRTTNINPRMAIEDTFLALMS